MNERTEQLIGVDGLNKLSKARVAIFGVGGVGGFVLEALVRSNIGHIDIYDFDTVAESNLNRQIIATTDMIGKPKVEVAKARALSINPELDINGYAIKVMPDVVPPLNYDYVIDCIDMTSCKLALIKVCSEKNIPIISSMGTGNKLDPSKLVLTDIYKTHTCPLAKAVRLGCKRLGIKHLKVVFSTELPKKSEGETIGTMIFVPASAGLLIASKVVKDLLELES